MIVVSKIRQHMENSSNIAKSFIYFDDREPKLVHAFTQKSSSGKVKYDIHKYHKDIDKDCCVVANEEDLAYFKKNLAKIREQRAKSK